MLTQYPFNYQKVSSEKEAEVLALARDRMSPRQIWKKTKVQFYTVLVIMDQHKMKVPPPDLQQFISRDDLLQILAEPTSVHQKVLSLKTSYLCFFQWMVHYQIERVSFHDYITQRNKDVKIDWERTHDIAFILEKYHLTQEWLHVLGEQNGFRVPAKSPKKPIPISPPLQYSPETGISYTWSADKTVCVGRNTDV